MLTYIGISIAIPVLGFWIQRQFRKKYLDSTGKFVVVTGCDSGIGLELVHQLRKWKFAVIACCLNDEGCQALEETEDVTAIQLDLRNEEDMRKVRNVVSDWVKNGKVFHGLVNNAGVMTYANFVWMNGESIRNEININLLGTILLTHHLIPLLRRSKGRLVTISSPVALLHSPKMPLYCTTKAGLETFSHCLRREVGDSLRIIIVRPCNLPQQTGILRRNAHVLSKMKDEMSPEDIAEFGPEIDGYIEGFKATYPDQESTGPVKDQRLFDALSESLLAESPEVEYTAAPLYVKLVLWASGVLPSSFMDKPIARDKPMRIISLSESK